MELKDLSHMLKLENIQHIAVTGPHFSGTDSGAAALAHRLGHKYIPESDFDGSDFKAFLDIVSLAKEPFVIECPNLLYCGLQIPKHVLTVVMYRPLEDILAAQRKAGWSDKAEWIKFKDYTFLDRSRPVAYIQYQFAELYMAPNRRVEYLDYMPETEIPVVLQPRKQGGRKKAMAVR